MGNYFLDGIEVHGECKITPIIDGKEYNEAISDAFDMVGTNSDPDDNSSHFIYIANWWLSLLGGHFIPSDGMSERRMVDINPNFDPDSSWAYTEPYALDGPAGNELLIDVLREKAQAGVDVRVLGWASYALMNSLITHSASEAQSYIRINAFTIASINALRQIPEIGAKAVINDIGHMGGAAHAKFVIVGNEDEAVAFTGGLDFAPGRWSEPGHSGSSTWHDVAVKIEGPVVADVYELFENMYMEATDPDRRARRYRVGGEKVPGRLSGSPASCQVFAVGPKGNHNVQSLHTLPMQRYALRSRFPKNPPLSFAPDGAFQFSEALQHAIEQAETYIFMEDQSFWSEEILSWVGKAVKDNPDLKVILLSSGGADPNDPEFPNVFLNRAINQGLCADLSQDQLGRIRYFNRMGDTVNICPLQVVEVTSEAGTSELVTTIDQADVARAGHFLQRLGRFYVQQQGTKYRVQGISADSSSIRLRVTNRGQTIDTGDISLLGQYGVVIHSKTVIIDDQWAQIGSANIMRRSQYTDIEHAVAFSGNVVSEYRQRLWADHFRVNDPSIFADMHASLRCWAPEWSGPPPTISRPAELEFAFLPFPGSDRLSWTDRWQYNAIADVDSRDKWGGLIIP